MKIKIEKIPPKQQWCNLDLFKLSLYIRILGTENENKRLKLKSGLILPTQTISKLIPFLKNICHLNQCYSFPPPRLTTSKYYI